MDPSGSGMVLGIEWNHVPKRNDTSVDTNNNRRKYFIYILLICRAGIVKE